MTVNKKEKVLINIGKITKSFGRSGQIKIVFSGKLKLNLNIKGTIWLNISNKMVPFFIDSIASQDKQGTILSLQEINTPEKATELTGYEVFYPVKVEKAIPITEQSTNVIKNFKLYNQSKKELGNILEVTESSGQVLLTVNNKGKQILVPFHENLLVDLDFEKQYIVLDIPEGLEEL